MTKLMPRLLRNHSLFGWSSGCWLSRAHDASIQRSEDPQQMTHDGGHTIAGICKRDKLRTSRIAISTADITNEFILGVPGEAFTFSQYINKVTVAEAPDWIGKVSQIEQFIREHAKP